MLRDAARTPAALLSTHHCCSIKTDALDLLYSCCLLHCDPTTLRRSNCNSWCCHCTSWCRYICFAALLLPSCLKTAPANCSSPHTHTAPSNCQATRPPHLMFQQQSALATATAGAVDAPAGVGTHGFPATLAALAKPSQTAAALTLILHQATSPPHSTATCPFCSGTAPTAHSTTTISPAFPPAAYACASVKAQCC